MSNQNYYNSNLTPEQQQQQLQWQYQHQMHQHQQQQQQFNPFQHNNFSNPPPTPQTFSSVPPPPPEEPSTSQSQQNNFQAGFNNNNRGDFQKSNSNRGQYNKQSWSRGGQRGGNRGGQFSSGAAPKQGNGREMQQNQVGSGQNKNRNNRNFNQQNWNQNRQNEQPQASNDTAQPHQQQSHQQQSPAPQSNPQSVNQEDVEFNEQFHKWQEEFDNWKKANVNHPDKHAYNQYEQQFESVRQKLLQRRAEMQKKKQVEQQAAAPNKTAEQLKFESQWAAGTAQEEKKPEIQPQPSTSTAPMMIPPPSGSETFVDDSFDDCHTFDHQAPNLFPTSFNNKAIPGIECRYGDEEAIAIDDPMASIRIIEPNLEDEPYIPPRSPPPHPKFQFNPRRPMTDIRDILDEPGRSKRAARILILIRGAPGSGKSYLANLIQEKEVKMGNNRVAILSMNKMTRDKKLDPKMIDTYQDRLLRELRSIIREEEVDFVIMEMEGGKTLHFNKFVHISMTMGDFKCYVIEMHQDKDVCWKYNKNRRKQETINQIITDLAKHPPPAKVLMVDPTALLQPAGLANITDLLQDKNVMNLLQSQLQSQPKPLIPVVAPPAIPPQRLVVEPNYSESFDDHVHQSYLQGTAHQPMNTQNYSQGNVHQPMNTQNYPQGNVHQPMNTQNYPQGNMQRGGKENFNYNQQQMQQQPQEPQHVNHPTFTPSKIIDYKHVHMPTFEEKLMEFKTFRVVDYKHKTTQKLWEFIQGVDTDKVIERRKAIALRKKILEYLKNAERPEDTVSNPKYPRNWEAVVPVDRPPLKNKRKKRLTAKIHRVRAIATERDWMKGYNIGSQRLELDEISSDEGDMEVDEDDDVAVVEDKEVKVVDVPDVLKGQPTTIPDFNHFKHANVMNLEDLLWSATLLRPRKILLIMRGPPGAGKSHLAQLIKRREQELRKPALRILATSDYEDDDDEKGGRSQMIDNYLHQMVKFVNKQIKENLFDFIIVDAENCDLTYYNLFHNEGTSGGFATFTVELFQTHEICVAQDVHNNTTAEIGAAIKKLEANRVPSDHTLLLVSKLYADYNCLVNPALKKEEDEKPVKGGPADAAMDTDEPKPVPAPPAVIQSRVWPLQQILEEPGRSKRSERILIIMRGPSGVGKSHLTRLIRDKEAAMGNKNVAVVSIDDFDQYDVKKNVEAMLKNLRDIIRRKTHNFIIVDAENGNLDDYKVFHDVGTSFGFACFTIELHNDKNVCYTRNLHNRTIQDIEGVLEDMTLYPIPDGHVLLDPAYLYTEAPSAIPTVEVTSLKNEIHEEFRARLKQRLMVNGMFIEKNVEPPSKLPEFNWHNRDIVDIREILHEPGRTSRPDKIMIVLRGVPGSGKTFLAGLIERKEVEAGNRDQFKLLTIDEYFEREEIRKYVDKAGAACQEKFRKYDMEMAMLDNYMQYVMQNLTQIAQTAEFKFIVVDADCCDLHFYNQMYAIAEANGYAGYTIELNQDDDICLQYNDHQRDKDEIVRKNKIMKSNPTPDQHTLLDPECLYEEFQYQLDDESVFLDEDVRMEVSDDDSEEVVDEDEEKNMFGPLKNATTKSKWDDDADGSEVVIERLDGTRNKTFERLTMADYLQTEDEWTMRPSTSGKKRVRWADIEEKKAQGRLREIGFIVGQTDWNRMTDTSDGKSALEKTKFI